jgi:AraC-like DNA-binding protein
LERALVWEIWDVAQIDPLADGMIGEWLTLPQVADRLGVSISRVRQLFRDRKLLAVQRPDGKLCVPAAFLDGNQVVRGLHGTLTLLLDCGFDDADALRWLFTADASLPGTPIQAISENRRTEVNRRAQALAF